MNPNGRPRDEKWRSKTGQPQAIHVNLRTPQVHYLEYLAEQAGVSLSTAFGSVIDKHASLALLTYKPPRKEKKHLLIEPRHADILDRLAIKAGLCKTDIARRLIDEALANDRSLGG